MGGTFFAAAYASAITRKGKLRDEPEEPEQRLYGHLLDARQKEPGCSLRTKL
jgi:hypothetical protein